MRLFRGPLWLVPVLALVFTVSHAPAPAVSDGGLWVELDPASLSQERGGIKMERPSSTRMFSLDRARLEAELVRAPESYGNRPGGGGDHDITLPLPDGRTERFAVEKSSVMTPDLMAQYPNIQGYRLRGLDDPTASGRLTSTPEGISALIISPRGISMIQPGSYSDDSVHDVFGHAEARAEAERFACEVLGAAAAGPQLAAPITSGDVLTTYTMAVAATGEYTAWAGSAGNAINWIMNTVGNLNAIYEVEAAITFVVGCTSVYTDPTTDPFPTPDVAQDGTLNQQSDDDLDDVCGEDTYDVGHVFHARPSGYLGQALGDACTADKGKGATTGVDPSSSIFLIDALAHEVGHQFQAAHSYNGSDAGCSQRSAGSAYEIGSGSTIMSYAIAGCVEDLPGPADPYFHTVNYDQIVNWRDNGGCGSTSNTGNAVPTINAGPDVTIPRNTPFVLTATGNDADGNGTLTFCWEQYDLGAATPPYDPAQGPMFRSRPPVAEPERYFPPLADVLGGTLSAGENYPTVDRSLTFRCTVRDNMAGGGGVDWDDMTVTVSGDPFFVTAPNGGEVLFEGCPFTVTWTVGGGDVADDVDILLSDDDGATWMMLAAATANDGSEELEMPCLTGSGFRVMVRAVGNVFYDVSDNGFFVSSVDPEVTGSITGGEVDDTCSFTVTFEATVTDDCAILADSVKCEVVLLTGNATLGTPSINKVQQDGQTVTVTGSVEVSDLTSCPATVGFGVIARDECGNVGSNAFEADIVDTTPPEITVTVDPEYLWPPNHKMVEVCATVTATDACPGVSYVLSSITSSEPDNDHGDGNTTGDIAEHDTGTDDTKFLLRAERDGRGEGRKYTIIYTATDGCGNSASDTACVIVPHDMGEIASGASVGAALDSVEPAVDRLRVDVTPRGGAVLFHALSPESGPVRLEVFDVRGRRIDVVSIHAGAAVTWNGEGRAPSGMYYMRAIQGGETATRSFVLLR